MYDKQKPIFKAILGKMKNESIPDIDVLSYKLFVILNFLNILSNIKLKITRHVAILKLIK